MSADRDQDRVNIESAHKDEKPTHAHLEHHDSSSSGDDLEAGHGTKATDAPLDDDRLARMTTAERNALVAARIKNPLSGIPRETLMSDVEDFAKEKGMSEHLDIFRKGALLAQNPADYMELDLLDDHDKEVVTYERAHKWAHPAMLYITVILCSVGAATQGWDQTGSNGANLSFPDEFGISTNVAEVGSAQAQANAWLVGVVNSAPYIASAGLGCWLSDPLNNYFGRRGTIFITALILIITPICSGLTQSWQTLFVVRLILGIGMGAKGSTVPIYAAENSPAQIRGALVMGWQLWTAFGIFLGFAANVIVKDTGSIAWRLQLGSAFIPAVPLAIGIFFCPESPRWLMKKGRYQQAYRSLLRLRPTPLQAARDLYYIHVQLVTESKIVRASNYFTRFAELFTIPRVRRATLASGVVMFAQQLCGINIIAFYSSTVFVDAGYSSSDALYASLGFGAVNFTFAIPALFVIDTFGRRSLLLFTFPQMAWTLLVVAFSFLISDTAGGGHLKIGMIACFIYVFAAFYSVGEGPVPFAYSAEVFPLSHREQGMAWAVTVCLGWAAVLSICFPAMTIALSPTGAFGFFAGLNVLAFVLIFLFVPETKQRTLEELDQVFALPTSEFSSYQVKRALPYFIKRWVLFRKDAHLEPLYQADREVEANDADGLIGRAEAARAAREMGLTRTRTGEKARAGGADEKTDV